METKPEPDLSQFKKVVLDHISKLETSITEIAQSFSSPTLDRVYTAFSKFEKQVRDFRTETLFFGEETNPDTIPRFITHKKSILDFAHINIEGAIERSVRSHEIEDTDNTKKLLSLAQKSIKDLKETIHQIIP